MGDWHLQNWKIFSGFCSSPNFSPPFSSPSFPPLQLRPSFSSPANSTPATSSVIVQFCSFQSCNFRSCKFSYPLVDSGGSNKAPVQSYLPGGANVLSWEGTFVPRGKYDWTVHPLLWRLVVVGAVCSIYCSPWSLIPETLLNRECVSWKPTCWVASSWAGGMFIWHCHHCWWTGFSCWCRGGCHCVWNSSWGSKPRCPQLPLACQSHGTRESNAPALWCCRIYPCWYLCYTWRQQGLWQLFPLVFGAWQAELCARMHLEQKCSVNIPPASVNVQLIFYSSNKLY